MSVRTRPCRDCDATVLWWQSPAGAWQLYDSTPKPYVPGYPGVVVRRHQLVDAGTAWPEPDEALPRHRCPASEIRAALAPVGDDVDAWLDEWAPIVFPRPTRSPERVRRQA